MFFDIFKIYASCLNLEYIINTSTLINILKCHYSLTIVIVDLANEVVRYESINKNISNLINFVKLF